MMRIFDNVWKKAHGNKNNNKQNKSKTSEEQQKWQQKELQIEQQKELRMRRVIMNTIAYYLTDPSDGKSIKEEWVEFDTDLVAGVDKNDLRNKEFRKTSVVLKAIDIFSDKEYRNMVLLPHIA